MVSHPETGSDSPIGSDRDQGRDINTTYIYLQNIYESHNPTFFSIPASKERHPLVIVLHLKCGPMMGVSKAQ